MPIDSTALALIRSTPAVLGALLADVPADVVQAPNPEGWSLKDIVAHLVDAEGIALVERIQSLLNEEQPLIHSIDPPARLVAGGYGARGLEDLLGDLSRQRQEHASWLAGLTENQLQRAGRHDSVGVIKVIDIAHQWAAHDMAHLRQIGHMLQTHLAPMMGNTRGFYDV